MQQDKTSGQLVRVLDIQHHQQWPNHKLVTVSAETICLARNFGYSFDQTVILGLGEKATVTVAKDVFAFAELGKTMDGALFCYYLAREPQKLAV
jgi:hypothetical protein